MLRTPLTILLVAAAALAGCDQSDHNLTAAGPYDPQANAIANSGPVTMPPSIVASHPYRCKDNSLLFIDWMSDGAARVKTTREARATTIVVGGENPQLTGDSKAETVTYNGQSCAR